MQKEWALKIQEVSKSLGYEEESMNYFLTTRAASARGKAWYPSSRPSLGSEHCSGRWKMNAQMPSDS